LSGAAGLETNYYLYCNQAPGRARRSAKSGGNITSHISKDEAQSYEIDELVEKKFEGSLPAFIAAFTKRKDMSDRELDEVQQMIDRILKGGA
jgi:predicted transcriptional regulator